MLSKISQGIFIEILLKIQVPSKVYFFAKPKTKQTIDGGPQNPTQTNQIDHDGVSCIKTANILWYLIYMIAISVKVLNLFEYFSAYDFRLLK